MGGRLIIRRRSSESPKMTFGIELGAAATAGGSLATLGVLIFNGLGLLLAKSAIFNNEFKFPNITIFGINFGRRRRDVDGLYEPVELTGLLTLMDVLDPDHCLPLALCSAAAIDPTNRTELCLPLVAECPLSPDQ